VKNAWDDAEGGRAEGDLAQRVYSSRLLGRDPDLVLHGGGNTSVKSAHRTVFGEVIDALHQARIGGMSESAEAWRLERALVSHLERVWVDPDHGIWEVRGGPQHFTHSKVMAWVAVDRAIKTAEQFGLAGPVERWRALRRDIHEDVCRRGYDAALGTFVQAYGSRELDASLLLIPLVGFLPPDDPRVRGTVDAIRRELVEDGFVRRYRAEAEDIDGLPGTEATFLPCSFWLAEALALMG